MSRTARALAGSLAGTLLITALAGCASDGSKSDSERGGDTSAKGNGDTDGGTDGGSEQPVKVTSSAKGSAVTIDQPLRLTAAHGTISKVKVTGTSASGAAALSGEISSDNTTWESSSRLEPGTAYVVKAVTKNQAGTKRVVTRKFRTVDLSLDQQTYASVSPLQGETVGIGMPVVVHFDVAVSDKASIEKHMSVTSSPAQAGAWHWISDTEAHWRPKKYWQSGTDVTVDIDVNSVPAGGGIYGQESRTVDFQVGDAVISKVNAQTHQMKTFINGKLAKTTPITTGKPGFTTRSGVKVIMEKFRSRRMNSETVGIPAGSADAYDINNVEYAMRVTNSGEFLHAAPWSVGQQGYANVSHGCTGMSTENARWIYENSKRGDVVEYTGTDRPMTLDNGYGDWNASFQVYKKGSALS